MLSYMTALVDVDGGQRLLEPPTRNLGLKCFDDWLAVFQAATVSLSVRADVEVKPLLLVDRAIWRSRNVLEDLCLDLVDVFERDVCEVQSPTCDGVRSSLDARLVGLGLRVGGPGEVDDAAPAGSAKLKSALNGRGFASRELSGRFRGVEEDVALVRGCCSSDQGG